jgi:O-antigen/teichoic acid export membrane protein
MLATKFVQYALARGLPGLLALATLFAYTRLLTPQDYGNYAIAVSAATVIGVLLFDWQRLFIARWISKHKGDSNELWKQATRIFTHTSVICLVIGVLFALLFSNQLKPALVFICALLAISTQWSEFVMTYLAAELKPRSYGLIRAVRGGVALGIGVVLIYAGCGGEGALVGLICGGFLAVAIVQPSGRRFPTIAAPKTMLVREQLQYGLPIIASLPLLLVVHVSDRFFLQAFNGASAVGLYSASYDLTQYTIALAIAVVQVAAYPLVFKVFESQGSVAAMRQFSLNAELTVAVCIGSAGFLYVLREPIAGAALGKAYQEVAVLLMPWIAVAAALNGLRSTLFEVPFHLAAKTKSLVWIGGIAALANLLLNFLLIPKHGLLGAAIATVAAFAVSVGVSYMLGKPLRLMPPLIPLFVRGGCVALIGSVGAFMASLMPLPDVVKVLAGTILFALGAGGTALSLNLAGARDTAYAAWLHIVAAVNLRPGN